MSKIIRNIPTVGNTDFDWSIYEDGWNGSSVKVNGRVKTGDKRCKVYSHEAYANDLVVSYLKTQAPVSKELHKDTLVAITDFSVLNTNKDTILASINGGANNIVIDLNKEQKFFNTLSIGNGERMTKESFLECLKDPEVRKAIIDMGLVAKVGTDVEKASIWDGYVENLSVEMREQIHKNNKAYKAVVISSNNGGFVVEVANTVKAFMPGSMAAANKLTNYESLVGQEMEVMVESYDKKLGFVVSRKKYLRTITPIYLRNLEEQLKENKDTVLTGTVTGTTQFGIFVELNEVLTGMVHKTLLSDNLREMLRKNEVLAGSQLPVYVHKIEKGRIILSDVPLAERDAVIARREAEDAAEKTEYVAAKREAVKAVKINAENITSATTVEIPAVEA